MNASFALLIGLSVWQYDGEVVPVNTVSAPATVSMTSCQNTCIASDACLSDGCATGNLCQPGGLFGHWGMWGNCYTDDGCKLKKRSWLCWKTTGDMYPHYPYPPAYHGYYYFRPYNYTNILRQKGEIIALGGNPKAPYAHKMFDRIYEQIDLTAYEEFPADGDGVPTLEPIRNTLPSLEDILKSK